MVKNDHHDISELKVMPLNVLFYLTNSPKSKNIWFSIMYEKEKHQILTFEKLGRANVSRFCFKK